MIEPRIGILISCFRVGHQERWEDERLAINLVRRARRKGWDARRSGAMVHIHKADPAEVEAWAKEQGFSARRYEVRR